MDKQELQIILSELIDEFNEKDYDVDFLLERYAGYILSRFRMNRQGDW